MLLTDSKSQILIQIFAPFPIRALLAIAPTSPRFSSLILRIIHYRLLDAASLPSHRLILEAYPPTHKYSEPWLYCTYLGTPGLSPNHEGEGSIYEETTEGQRYARLSQVYSRFRPESPAVEGSMPRRPSQASGNNTGQAATGSDTSPSSQHPIYGNNGDGGKKKIEHLINLDSCELFSQFCTIASLVKEGPRRGVFSSIFNVEDKVMRVWRDWLEERARESTERTRMQHGEAERESRDNLDAGISTNPSILWTDQHRNVGLLVSVRDRKFPNCTTAPILISAEEIEEQPVSYSVEIRGTSQQIRSYAGHPSYSYTYLSFVSEFCVGLVSPLLSQSGNPPPTPTAIPFTHLLLYPLLSPSHTSSPPIL